MWESKSYQYFLHSVCFYFWLNIIRLLPPAQKKVANKLISCLLPFPVLQRESWFGFLVSCYSKLFSASLKSWVQFHIPSVSTLRPAAQKGVSRKTRLDRCLLLMHADDPISFRHHKQLVGMLYFPQINIKLASLITISSPRVSTPGIASMISAGVRLAIYWKLAGREVEFIEQGSEVGVVITQSIQTSFVEFPVQIFLPSRCLDTLVHDCICWYEINLRISVKRWVWSPKLGRD